jgi:hypothetical protein
MYDLIPSASNGATMNKDYLYDNEKEKTEHIQAVRFLAENGGFSEEDVLAVYEQVLEGLRHEAIIKSFLTVLVSRRVRDILQKKRHPFNA